MQLQMQKTRNIKSNECYGFTVLLLDLISMFCFVFFSHINVLNSSFTFGHSGVKCINTTIRITLLEYNI